MIDLLKREVAKVQNQMSWVLVFFIAVGILPYVHFHYLDGVVYNRVLSYHDGINPLALETNSKAYCPGDPVYIETNFCKHRMLESVDTAWWSSNGNLSLATINPLLGRNGGQLPVGCYPADGTGRQLVYIHDVPETALPGTEFSIGYTQHTLPSGEVRDQAYRTATYTIKTAEECE